MFNPRAFPVGVVASLLLIAPALGEYNPVTGRFLQRDPVATGQPVLNDQSWFQGRAPYISPNAFDAQTQYSDGMNLYQYVASNPVSRTDPLGLFTEDDPWNDIDAAIGGLYEDRLGAYAYTRDALGHARRGSFLAQLYARMAFAWDDFVWDQNEGILFDLALGGFLARACFEEGTTVLLADGTASSIECVSTATRVESVAAEPGPSSMDAFFEPTSWRLIRLQLQNGAGGISYIDLIRPSEWVAAVGARAGGTIWLNVPEMGIDGVADVRAIEPCPASEPGPLESLVTGTFKTEFADTIRVILSNSRESIGVTETHPFFSLDRATWVPAGRLRRGERVKTVDGVATIARLELRPTASTVYNLEVAGTHTYFVSGANVWVHNGCVLSPDVKPRGNAKDLKGAVWPAVRRGDTVFVAAGHGQARSMAMGGNPKTWVGRIPIHVEEGFVEFLDGIGKAYRWVSR